MVWNPAFCEMLSGSRVFPSLSPVDNFLKTEYNKNNYVKKEDAPWTRVIKAAYRAEVLGRPSLWWVCKSVHRSACVCFHKYEERKETSWQNALKLLKKPS